MSKRGKRSRESRERRERLRKEREQQKSEYERAHRIVLDFSWQDQITGEKVFTDETCGEDSHGNKYTFKLFLEKKLVATFGFTPQHALEYEFGEVLNRFG